MARLVQKFDGSSLNTPEKIARAARFIVTAAENGYEVASVVSPSKSDVNSCLSFAGNLSKNPNMREVQSLLGAYEQMSSTLLSMAIESFGFSSRSLSASALGIESFRNIRSEDLQTSQVESCFERGEIAVIGGGSAISDAKALPSGIIDYSDSLAIALGAAIDAEKCEYFTGDSGLFVADPLYVNNPSPVDCLDYSQASEWARCGANFLSAEAIEMAAEIQMPIFVRSLPNEKSEGTFISHRLAVLDNTTCGIVVDNHLASLTLSRDNEVTESESLNNVPAMFLRFAELGIETDMLLMLARENSNLDELAFVVKEQALPQVLRILEANSQSLGLPHLHVDKGYSRVSVIARELNNIPYLVSEIFERLRDAHLSVKLIATSDLRISFLIQGEFAGYAVKVIHDVLAYVQSKDELELS